MEYSERMVPICVSELVVESIGWHISVLKGNSSERAALWACKSTLTSLPGS
jgi:hypothetical protein